MTTIFMPYVVKRIYNRLYVYRQFRVGKKVVSVYIGPLDKIAEFYEKFNKNMGPPGFEPGIRPRSTASRSPAPQAGILSKLDDGPHHICEWLDL